MFWNITGSFVQGPPPAFNSRYTIRWSDIHLTFVCLIWKRLWLNHQFRMSIFDSLDTYYLNIYIYRSYIMNHHLSHIIHHLSPSLKWGNFYQSKPHFVLSQKSQGGGQPFEWPHKGRIQKWVSTFSASNLETTTKIPSLSLTVRSWKMVLGRRSGFLLGFGHFLGAKC